MRAYRSQILNYLADYEKARTTEEILNHIASQRGGLSNELTERRRRSIMTCLRKLEQERVVLTKKSKDGTLYWSTNKQYLDNIDLVATKIPLKELLKTARRTHQPIKFFRG